MVMEKIGYTSVMTLSAGLPGWSKAGYPTTASAGDVSAKEDKGPQTVGPITLGSSEGTVDVDWFKTIVDLKNRPKNIHVLDLRSPEDHAKGHLPGYQNIPAKDKGYEEFVANLPKDGYVIMACSTGTRSLEKWLLLQEKEYDRLEYVYYLDAEVNCNARSECTIKGFDLDF